MKSLFKNLVYLFLALIALATLSACQSVKEGLTGTKRSNSDEFLVEKKNPLVLPPEFEKLPVPNSIVNNDQNIDNSEDNDLRVILGQEKNSIKTESKTKKTNTSLEKSIIEKIKNN